MAAVWKKLAYFDEIPVKASGAELDTGTNDTKFATAAALLASHNVPSVVPSTAGKVLTSDGTDWTSAAPAAAAAHALLGAIHDDTLADTVTAGDVIFGNDTPKWASLAITVPAAGLINHLAVANAETKPTWKALFDATVPGTIAPSDAAAAGTAVVAARRDHAHATPATYPATAHAVSGHSVAVANPPLGGYWLTDQVIQTVANVAAVNAYATPVLGKILWSTAELAAYLCTAIA